MTTTTTIHTSIKPDGSMVITINVPASRVDIKSKTSSNSIVSSGKSPKPKWSEDPDGHEKWMKKRRNERMIRREMTNDLRMIRENKRYARFWELCSKGTNVSIYRNLGNPTTLRESPPETNKCSDYYNHTFATNYWYLRDLMFGDASEENTIFYYYTSLKVANVSWSKAKKTRYYEWKRSLNGVFKNGGKV